MELLLVEALGDDDLFEELLFVEDLAGVFFLAEAEGLLAFVLEAVADFALARAVTRRVVVLRVVEALARLAGRALRVVVVLLFAVARLVVRRAVVFLVATIYLSLFIN